MNNYSDREFVARFPSSYDGTIGTPRTRILLRRRGDEFPARNHQIYRWDQHSRSDLNGRLAEFRRQNPPISPENSDDSEVTFENSITRHLKLSTDINFLQKTKMKFLGFERKSGFTAEEISSVSPNGGLEEKMDEFPNHMKRYLCEICQQFPFNPSYCSKCNRLFCYQCKDQVIAFKSRCSTGYEPDSKHKFEKIPTEMKVFLNTYVKIKCLFGCSDKEGNPKSFVFIDGQYHHSHLCPYLSCKRCGLLSRELNTRHKNLENCFEQMKNFSVFSEAVKQYMDEKNSRKLISYLERLENITTEHVKELEKVRNYEIQKTQCEKQEATNQIILRDLARISTMVTRVTMTTMGSGLQLNKRKDFSVQVDLSELDSKGHKEKKNGRYRKSR